MAIVNTRDRRPLTAGRAPRRAQTRVARRLGWYPQAAVTLRFQRHGPGLPVPRDLALRHAPRSNTKIGGRPATETVTAGRWCQALGGSRTIMVVIPQGASDNWYEMDACLRAPGIPAEQAEIAAMLKTVRLAPSN